jgi:hypothetical protein
MLYNRGNKQVQSGEEISKGFLNSKYILWIAILIMLIAFVIEYIILKITNSGLRQKVEFYSHMTDFSLIFNRLFCSILSLSCVAKSPDSTECINHIDYYSEMAIKNSVINTTNSTYDNNSVSLLLNFKELLFNQEQILSGILETIKGEITNDLGLIDDTELLQLFEENTIHYILNKNFENNKLNLSIKQESLTFFNALLLITSRCNILTKDFTDLNDSIYILNKLDQ